MSVQIVFVLFVAIALVGWGIAELKGKMTYTHSKEEAQEAEEILEQQEKNNFHEMNLHDLLEHNSTKGYNAVD